MDEWKAVPPDKNKISVSKQLTFGNLHIPQKILFAIQFVGLGPSLVILLPFHLVL